MKSTKGFTLVELLAVIVIMAILITVAVPSVLIFSNNMKKNMYCNKIDTIEKAAILYGEDNYDSIFGSKTPNSCVVDSENILRCQKVTLKALMSKGYLKKEENVTTGEKDEIYDPRTNESIKDTEVYVTIKNKRPYATYVYKTKSDAELCDGQLYISDDKVTVDPENKNDELYNKDTSIGTCTFSYNVTLQSSGWFNKYPTPTVTTSEAGASGLKFGYGETSTPNYDLGFVRAGKIGKKEVTPILQDTAGKTIYCFVSSLEGKENIVSEEIKIDTQKPVLTVSNSSDTTYTKTKNISFSIQDTLSGLPATSTIEYAWSKSATTEPTTWKTKIIRTTTGNKKAVSSTIDSDSGLEGTYYLWIKGGTLKDLAGNKHNLSSTHYGPYNFDNTAPAKPTITLCKWTTNDQSSRPSSCSGLTGYVSDTWSEKNITTIASGGADTGGSGFKEYQYTTTGRTTNVTNQVATKVDIDAQGTSYIKWRACDNAGNCSDWVTNTIKVDKTAPTIPTSVIRLNNSTGAERTNSNSWTNETRWWGSFNASDANGNIEVSGIKEYQFSTGCTGNASGILNEYHLYNSTVDYSFCIRAVDNVGNTSNWSSPYYFKIDKVAPTCGTAVGATTTWTTGNRTVTLNCVDNESGCESATYPKTYTTSTKTDTVQIKDKAGNTTSCTYNAYVDKSNDVCTFNSSNQSALIGHSITFSGKCNASATPTDTSSKTVSCNYTNDIGRTTTCSGTYTGVEGNVKNSSGIHYNNLEEAFNNTANGGTITVNKDYTDSSSPTLSSKKVTLQLNGKTVTKSTKKITINAGSEIIVNGSGAMTSGGNEIVLFHTLGNMTVQNSATLKSATKKAVIKTDGASAQLTVNAATIINEWSEKGTANGQGNAVTAVKSSTVNITNNSSLLRSFHNRVVEASTKATINFNAGIIENGRDNSNSVFKEARGFANVDSATFNMNGGKMSNYATDSGAGIMVNGDTSNGNGVFNLNGGSLYVKYLPEKNCTLCAQEYSTVNITEKSGDVNITTSSKTSLQATIWAKKDTSYIKISNDISVTCRTENPNYCIEAQSSDRIELKSDITVKNEKDSSRKCNGKIKKNGHKCK